MTELGLLRDAAAATPQRRKVAPHPRSAPSLPPRWLCAPPCRAKPRRPTARAALRAWSAVGSTICCAVLKASVKTASHSSTAARSGDGTRRTEGEVSTVRTRRSSRRRAHGDCRSSWRWRVGERRVELAAMAVQERQTGCEDDRGQGLQPLHEPDLGHGIEAAPVASHPSGRCNGGSTTGC